MKRINRVCLIPACIGFLASGVCLRADTVLTFDATPPGQFHNNPIIQTFGDNASASGPGIEVTGIGTPDINLTWSAINNPNNQSSPSTRWDYYVFPGEPWAAAQLNQSHVGDYHDILFAPGNNSAVVIKSFKFHGYYGVLSVDGTNVQERFSYNWQVLDTNALAVLTSGSYTFLSDSNKNHPVNINYTGATNQALLLRLTRVASTLATGGDPVEIEGDAADIAIDDITFSEQVGAANPGVASVSLQDGATNVAPAFAYHAVLSDGFNTQVASNSVRLALDGIVLSPSIAKAGLTTTIDFSAGGLLRSGSTHTYTLTFSDNAATPAKYTNSVTFTVQPYTSYEWRFTAGDLSTSLGNGRMTYVDSATTGETGFGTSDGSTVPNINGVPTKYMHVPAFQSDTEGYYLYLDDTPPNAPNDPYINRYTIIYDILVPPALDWLPFFNTDPFNLNDADFYLASDGSIGIGSGYSAVNVITPSTWYRIAFVCDLVQNTLTYYVNGTNVASRAADGLGGRWSLYSRNDAAPQFLLFNEGDTSGVYTHELYLSSVAVADRALTGSELNALGGPNANGILVRSFSPRPSLAIQGSGSAATISWPSTQVGYALEQATSLVSPQWKPVPGITNNSVSINTSTNPTFYRLVQ